MLYKNSLIKLFEEHLFHFRISHVLEMNCFVQTEVQATPITSPTWKWYIKSVANVSKRANTASTSFHKRTWKNPSLILIVHLTNFAHPKWVDIHINFPVFWLGDFCQNLSYTKRFYSYDIKVHQLKIANGLVMMVDIFFLGNLVALGLLEFFQHFLSPFSSEIAKKTA